MTYLPDDSPKKPPLANNITWDLNDGGQWKSQNKFPVYAIPGAEGAAIMQQLGQYSGNSSSAKIKEILEVAQLDPADYVRLYTSFGTDNSSNLPSLWAFLLIILGLVLFVVGATSVLMHWLQRRRRRDLQRRVNSGEVDLESLGIKRIRITQDAINSLGTSTYTRHTAVPSRTDIAADPPSEHSTEQPAPSSFASTSNYSQWSQPTCPICLDDFVDNTTTVRSLPCHHIYHPECIDPFLRDNSSLCPVCKAPVIPAGSQYRISEPVTNAMVRHERRARRERESRQSGNLPIGSTAQENENQRWTSNFRRCTGRRVFSAPSRPGAARTTSQLEMDNMERRAVSGQVPAGASSNGTEGARVPPTDANLRREWMRRRLSTLRGSQRTLDEEEEEMSARTPKCKWPSTFNHEFC